MRKRSAHLKRIAALVDGAAWAIENGGDVAAALVLLRRYAQWLRREAERNGECNDKPKPA